jgi:hypothetical protein
VFAPASEPRRSLVHTGRVNHIRFTPDCRPSCPSEFNFSSSGGRHRGHLPVAAQRYAC